MIIRYSGGEPLLHPDALEILAYGAERGMYQVLFTNGHFLTEQLAGRLVSANVRSVLISLHGDRQVHNELAGHRHAYDRAMRAMTIALDAGIEIVAEMTLVQHNVDGALDVMRDAYAQGVREFRVMRYVPTGKRDEQYAVPIAVMLPLMKKMKALLADECSGMRVGWPCGQKFCTSLADTPLAVDEPTLDLRREQLTGHCESGLVWGSVSFDGRLRNCPHSNVYFGDVNEGIAHGWCVMTQAVARAIEPRQSCSGCAVASSCKGGCHLPQFIETKSRRTGWSADVVASR